MDYEKLRKSIDERPDQAIIIDLNSYKRNSWILLIFILLIWFFGIPNFIIGVAIGLFVSNICLTWYGVMERIDDMEFEEFFKQLPNWEEDLEEEDKDDQSS